MRIGLAMSTWLFCCGTVGGLGNQSSKGLVRKTFKIELRAVKLGDFSSARQPDLVG